ncbi:MAG: transcription termination/antitermination protein NusG [Candidatus Kappaea frigidicola]|nr:transcription termination/antitermination protein NusG [Candidatus Kappaea frigidicola]
MTMKWYVIHTLTGKEEKVRANLEVQINSKNLREKINQVFIPTENVSEITKLGKKKITKRHYYPGYVLIEMIWSDDVWYLIKNTSGVTGFIGAGRKPVPLKDSEIKTILRQTEEKKEKPVPKVVFEKGETLRVKEGPFTNFSGVVEEVYPDKGKLKVAVAIFGRSTPVELDYWQVERI